MWFILAISAAALWGLNYTLIENVLKQKISPLTLVAIEILFGLIIYAIYLLGFEYKHTKHDLMAINKDHSLLIKVIFISLTFHAANLLIFFAIKLKDATLTGLIELTYPLFTILFSWLLFRIFHLSVYSMTGAALILVGCFLLQIK